MRVAVISDIHANLPALESVFREIDADPPDAIWCLGDLVGYGPRPNESCALVEERADVCLVGNHDLVCLGRIDLSEFNHEAAAAASWTREVLTPASREFLEPLSPHTEAEGAELFHGSPVDPVWSYVLTDEVAYASFRATEAALILVGHSHVALRIHLEDDELNGGVAPAGAGVDVSNGRWLLNPGSVGQPRDGDPRAAWLELDFERRFASFRRVAYPIERTQHEMRDAGLPETLVARLEQGQ